MAVYTSMRDYTKHFAGSRVRTLSGYVRPSDTSFDMLEVSGMLTDGETLDGVLSLSTMGVPTSTPFMTSVSANASMGGRITFNYTKIDTGATANPTGSGTTLQNYCEDGEWNGNLNINYDGPSCDKVRVTGASGSLTTITNSGTAITNTFEGALPTWLSVDTTESGTEYDPTEGERSFVRKDIFDDDFDNVPGDWFTLSTLV